MINGDVTDSRAKGRASWNPTNNPPTELRRPHIHTGNPSRTESQVIDDGPKSTLSAEAKEWFPPNYIPPTESNYVPPHNVGYHNNSHSHSHSHYYHSGHHGNSGYQGRGGYHQRSYEPNNHRFSVQSRLNNSQPQEHNELKDSIEQLITVMCEVTFSPGKFAVLSGPLVDQFSVTLNDLEHTQPLVDAIVNQAIGEANFRYNGARLCTMFDSVNPHLQSTSLFRVCLLERCAAEETKIVSGGEVLDENICGFAMFLAELYMQLENPEGGRIKALGDSLCKVLNHLLLEPKNNNTKSVCQILKLSGLALDADCKVHVDEIFSGLQRSEREGVQTLLVRNVINLRQSRWGSAGFAEMADIETPPPSAPPIILSHNGSSQRGVGVPPEVNVSVRQANNGEGGMFYLPDGHSLTSEEAAFLSRHLPPANEPPSSDDGDEAPDDSDNEIWNPEINAEQRADFMEFLRSSNQITR